MTNEENLRQVVLRAMVLKEDLQKALAPFNVYKLEEINSEGLMMIALKIIHYINIAKEQYNG